MTNPDTGSEDRGRIPFGQDFTPATLGKVLGENAVLEWLLRTASGETRAAFASKVAAACLSHVKGINDRRDMASHVVAAMRSYKLIEEDNARIALTPTGVFLRDAADTERDLYFARHIITMCEGQRFLEAIRRYELRGEVPGMEDLSVELGEGPTSKNISTMRAWLARAGVVSLKGPYRVEEARLGQVLGEGVSSYFGLEPLEFEFLLAARILMHQSGTGPALDAVAVADLAESRADTRIRRKSLDRFVKRLAQRGLIRTVDALAGKGGTRTAFQILEPAVELTEAQLRALVAQSDAGFDLSKLVPLATVLQGLGAGIAEEVGRLGEQLAIHLCLMLGLRVRHWRRRAPHAEIDLIADRLSALTYQRWAVQVKNTIGALDSDQVAREVGATTGLGVSHILFVVPRAEITEPARQEIRTKSRLTNLHVYKLTAAMLAEKNAESMLRHLRRQAQRLEADKRAEAEARERHERPL